MRASRKQMAAPGTGLRRGARLYAAVFCALAFGGAGLLRAEEPKSLNGIRLSDVKAYEGAAIPEPVSQAVVLPPVSLDRKSAMVSLELDAQGRPVRAAISDQPYLDLSLSPVYQSWLYFFENGGRAAEDIEGEWTLVGAVSFSTWQGSRDGKTCKALFRKPVCRLARVLTNPDGLRLFSADSESEFSEAEKYYPEDKMTLNFADRTVWASSVFQTSDHERCGYSKSADSVALHDCAGLNAYVAWKCRVFKDDGSKLICRIAERDGPDRWHARQTYFLVYARDDGKDLLEPMPGILKPFLTPPPPAVTLTKPRPKK